MNLADELQSVSDEYRGALSKKEMFMLLNKIVNSDGYNYLLVC